MLRYFLTAICCVYAFGSVAQQDTTYFDKSWKQVESRAEAAYYRPQPVMAEPNKYHVRDYYITGQLQMEGYINNLDQQYKTGHYVYYDSSGGKTSEGDYMNNEREGDWVFYFDGSGKVYSKASFRNGKAHGVQTRYYKNGEVRRKESYNYGEMTEGHVYDEQGKELDYFPMEEMPEFPGNLQEFLVNNIVYPKIARKKNITGRVILRFIVDETGSIKDVSVLKSVSPEIDAEAVRVVKAMPKWKPGKQEGKPVKVWYTQPINFQLK